MKIFTKDFIQQVLFSECIINEIRMLKPGHIAHLIKEPKVPESGHILSFLFPLIQEGQLSVTGKSMCMKFWLTAKEV